MARILSLVAASLCFSAGAYSASITTLNPNWFFDDTGKWNGQFFAGGKGGGPGVDPLLYNLTTNSVVNIQVPQSAGVAPIFAEVTAIDSSAGMA